MKSNDVMAIGSLICARITPPCTTDTPCDGPVEVRPAPAQVALPEGKDPQDPPVDPVELPGEAEEVPCPEPYVAPVRPILWGDPVSREVEVTGYLTADYQSLEGHKVEVLSGPEAMECFCQKCEECPEPEQEPETP